MSRLIDTIEKAGLQSAPPLGFGAAAGMEQAAPDLVLIESVSAGQIDDPALGTSVADAIVVKSSGSTERTPSLEGMVWGVRSSSFTLEQSTDLVDKGCDFVVFESLETHASVLNDEDLGVIAAVPADMDEESVRALLELPVDGVLFTPPLREPPLTIGTLMAVQALRGLTDKSLLVEAPGRAGLRRARVAAAGGGQRAHRGPRLGEGRMRQGDAAVAAPPPGAPAASQRPDPPPAGPRSIAGIRRGRRRFLASP